MTTTTRLELLILILLFTSPLFSQTKELKVYYHDNGQVDTKGYDTCFTIINNKNKYTMCHPIGLWESWYENGNKKLEKIESNERIKYINMWLLNGKQILTNGSGIYYENEIFGNGLPDSSVFEIKDSIKNGFFYCYRSYKDGKYSLFESGQYENDKKVGQWTLRDSIYNVHEQTNYKDDEENGVFKSFFLSGKIKSEGQKINGKEEGSWKFYDENGRLLMECNYTLGRENGKYVEYNLNGTIKVEGQYIQISGYETISVENPNDPGKISTEKIYRNDIVALNGVWKYYNPDGKLIKTRTYKKKQKKGSH